VINKLIAAQPIVREGLVLKKSESGWIEKDIAADTETQVGYYHILATNMDEAINCKKIILNLNLFLMQVLR